MARLIDMTGKEFNGCVVLKREGTTKDRKATWKCLCYCGNTFVTSGKSIRLGLTKSCGCRRTEIIIKTSKKNTTHGETKTRLYNIWRGIKKRCYIPKDTSYKDYGAKGIRVCDEWMNSYESFRDWSLANGYEEHLTIDRINGKGDYNPENCRWVNWIVQGRNRSNNKRIMYKGEWMTHSEVAKKIGISRELLYYRRKNGIKLDEPKRISVNGKYVKQEDIKEEIK